MYTKAKENFKKVIEEIKLNHAEQNTRTSVINLFYFIEDLQARGINVINPINDEVTMNIECAANDNELFGDQNIAYPLIVLLEDNTIVNFNFTMFMNSSCTCYLGLDLALVDLKFEKKYHG